MPDPEYKLVQAALANIETEQLANHTERVAEAIKKRPGAFPRQLVQLREARTYLEFRDTGNALLLRDIDWESVSAVFGAFLK